MVMQDQTAEADDEVLDSISAGSWIIYDVADRRVMASKKESMKREVASLTKMMTFYTLLKLLVKYQLWPRQTYVQISKTAAKCIGTTANLVEGDVLTVE